MLEFSSREGRSPSPDNMALDLKLLKSLRESILEKFNLPAKKIPEPMMSLLFSQLSPVAAIVGGVLGQEIIKAISNENAPHNNFFTYNPLKSAGYVEEVGYPAEDEVKVNVGEKRNAEDVDNAPVCEVIDL